MLITKNLEREKNKVVKTFVETVGEAALPDHLLSQTADYEAMVKAELDKAAYANVFTEKEKNEAIAMFAASLQRGAALKKMADGFAGKMSGDNFQADAQDLTDIEKFFSDDKYNSRNQEIRSKLAKVMKNVDTRTLPKDNVLFLISNTAKGLSFFNSTIEANLMVQETEMIIEDGKGVHEAFEAAQKANDGVFDRFDKTELDNEELEKQYKNAVRYSKRYLDMLGDDFEQTVFAEDLEEMDKELKQIDELQHFAKVDIQDYANPYNILKRVEGFKNTADKQSPFYVPKELREYYKSVMNGGTFARQPTKAEKEPLKNYLQKLNSTLRKHGYQGSNINVMPNPEKAAELYKIMEADAQKHIAKAESKGFNEKAFTDMDGFLADLSNRRDEIIHSDRYQKAYAYSLAKENQHRAEKLKQQIDARNRVAGLNKKVVDSVEKTEKSLKNAAPVISANHMNIEEQMAGLYDRLGDKSSFFHINSPAFRKMKNVMKRFKDANDYLNQLARDEVEDNYAFGMKKGSLVTPQEVAKALQEAHDSAQKYLEEKREQTRKNPSEMRLARLEAAEEIVKLTGAYLKAHNTLENNEKAIKDVDHQVSLNYGSSLDFYRDHAERIEIPQSAELKLPTLQRKLAPEKQVQSEKVQEKQQAKDPVAMGALQ